MTSCITIKGSIRIPDAKKNNEAFEDNVLVIGFPKIPQGLSPLSSASLYLSTHSSTPCERFAKSLQSTFFCRYSSISAGKVIVTYGLRSPFSLGIQDCILYNIQKCEFK